VYQTKWLKYGLRALGLPDPYTVPQVKDSYSALVWWDYRDAYVPGNDARDRDNYPYLGWAVDHPVYQTKWLKYGLRALGLPDPYTVPQVKDSYSALVWWDYRDAYVPGNDARDRDNYPYLGWAVDHFHGEKGSPISNRDYPLTWERHASQANYAMLDVLDPVFVREKIAAPHTWHAAEVFLYLMNTSAAP